MVQVVMKVRLIIINLLLAFRRKTEICLTALRQAWEEGERWAHYQKPAAWHCLHRTRDSTYSMSTSSLRYACLGLDDISAHDGRS